MPIEFPCPQCGALLRVPDASVGKKAKCPKCEAINVVPAVEGSSPPAATNDPFQLSDDRSSSSRDSGISGLDTPSAPSGGSVFDSQPDSLKNPFADSSGAPFGGAKPKAADENPYATPSASADMYAGGPARPAGTLTPTQIGFSDTLGVAWSVFTDNLGFLVLVGLTFLGLALAVGAIVFAGVVGMGAMAGQNQFDATALVIMIPVGILFVIGLFVGMSWLEAGVVTTFLRLSRGEQAQLGDIFSGGRYILQFVFLNILRFLINFGISFVLGMVMGILIAVIGDPAVASIGMFGLYIAIYTIQIIITLILLLTPYFIVDREQDTIQAMLESMRYMRGNKLTGFAIFLVVGIVAIVLHVVTCGLGTILVTTQVFILLASVIYLLATGQRAAGYAMR